MQEQIQQSDLDKTEFEELLLRRESKERFDSKKFTKVVLKDISIYKGYKFAKQKNLDKDSINTEYINIISEYDSAEKTLQEHIGSSDSKNISVDYTNNDYIPTNDRKTLKINNKNWVYSDEKYFIATISSKNENYDKKYIIDSKHVNRNSNELYNKINDKLDSTCLIGSPIFSNKVLRFDKQQPISKKKMYMNGLLRSILMYGLVTLTLIGIVYIGLQYITGLYVLPYILLSLIVLSTAIAAGIPIGNRLYKDWFNLKDSDMLSKLPEKAEITKSEFTCSDDYNYDEANVDIYENGDVIINVKDITWTFDNNDNLPSEKAVKLYNNYGVDFNNEEKLPIIYYESKGESDKNSYLSDCDNWVLEPDVT